MKFIFYLAVFLLFSPSRVSAETEKNSGFAQKIDPRRALNFAFESKGLADLKKIYTACNVYMAEEDGKAPAFEQLIERGILTEEFSDHKNDKYVFEIHAKGPGRVSVSAEPVDPNSGLASFYADDRGTRRGAFSDSGSDEEESELPYPAEDLLE
jgi:hypothetical protein